MASLTGVLKPDGSASTQANTQARSRKTAHRNNSAALVSCWAEVLHPSQRPTPTWQNTIQERIAAEKTTKLDHPKTKTLINGSGETALRDWSDCQWATRLLQRWYARNNQTQPTNTTHHHVLSSYMLIIRTALQLLPLLSHLNITVFIQFNSHFQITNTCHIK